MTTHQKSLGDRMKEYENVTNLALYRRTPIILRIDGRAFHSVTRGMATPYDDNFITLMNYVTIEVFNSLSDAVIAYVESDEISVVLCPYSSYDTEPTFSGRIQKLCSVVASMATQAFIKGLYLKNIVDNNWAEKYLERNITFDCRCFNIQKDEVVNYLLWRQQDCKRNSILNAAHEYIGKKQSIGFKTTDLIDKLLNEKNIDYWTEIPKYVHYGRTCLKNSEGISTIDYLNFSDKNVVDGIFKMINFDYENREEYYRLIKGE